ncbi:hypothetical protein JW916_14950 [Candidatus Sumerlaeota bacterium]|nr:hypothetical protein [Candidatus Sumerlaeota bacterium]
MNPLFVLTVYCIILFPALAHGQTTSALTPESKAEILTLANTRGPTLKEILLPEEAVQRIESASLPQSVKTKSAEWIRKVVRAKWLPEDLEADMFGANDVKMWETREPDGTVSEHKYDYVLLDHNVEGHGIHVIESPSNVSIRVDFPKPREVSEDPSFFIKSRLAEFTNMPYYAFKKMDLEVVQDGPLYSASWRDTPTTATEASTNGMWWNGFHWWQRLTVCTDGRFFFLKVAESEPGWFNPQAQASVGIDRF